MLPISDLLIEPSTSREYKVSFPEILATPIAILGATIVSFSPSPDDVENLETSKSYLEEESITGMGLTGGLWYAQASNEKNEKLENMLINKTEPSN